MDMYESDDEEEGVNLDVVRRQEQPREEFGSTWILPLREQMAEPTKIQVKKNKTIFYLSVSWIPDPQHC